MKKSDDFKSFKWITENLSTTKEELEEILKENNIIDSSKKVIDFENAKIIKKDNYFYKVFRVSIIEKIIEEKTQKIDKKSIEDAYGIGAYTTDDNHHVRSRAEALVDNWLYNNGIAHAYEPKIVLPNKKTVYPDFFIPMQKIYIEVWGLNDKSYNNRKQYKRSLYKQYNMKLIEVYPKNLEDLNNYLREQLNELGLSVI